MSSLNIGDLEIFFRLGRQRLIRCDDLEDYEKERMKYFVKEGVVCSKVRKNPDFPVTEEVVFNLTPSGERTYLDILKYSENKLNTKKYFGLGRVLSFLKPAS